tara:strand:- start:54 stop:311 length:258 start_codon:yes stop_codon:yes gene_type:complete
VSKENTTTKDNKTNNVMNDKQEVDATNMNPKDVIESIRTQLNHHVQEEEKANRLMLHHRTQRTKAEGFLEVYLQIHPEDVAKEGK